MGTVDKEKLQIVRDFFKNNPEEAKKILKENPQMIEFITKDSTQVQNQSILDSDNGNSIGGNKLVKTMPGNKIPKMFDWDDSGFSNYLMLAILAFSIQLIITLVCIFFYK